MQAAILSGEISVYMAKKWSLICF